MKIASLSLFICACLLFCSCKETDYTCVCEGGFSGTGVSIEMKANSFSKAKRNCETYNDPNAADGFKGCKIK